MIFSHVLYQLSYLARWDRGDPGGAIFSSVRVGASRPIRRAALDQAADGAGDARDFSDFDQPVAGAFAPDGHVFVHGRVVAPDFEQLARRDFADLADREEDGQRAEGSTDIKAVRGVGQIGLLR